MRRQSGQSDPQPRITKEGDGYVRRMLVQAAQSLAATIGIELVFALLGPPPVNLVCPRFDSRDIDDPTTLNQVNDRLESMLNASAQFFLTPTQLRTAYALRFAVGQTQVTQADVAATWKLVQETA